MSTYSTFFKSMFNGLFSARGMAYFIVGLTLLKIAAVVLQSPIFGYANNYDFTRKSACTGIWQNYSDQPKNTSHPIAPVNNLVFDNDRSSDLCVKSIDNFFAHISRQLHRAGDQVDFREMSAYRLAFLAAMVLLLMRVTEDNGLKILFSMLFFLVWGDFTVELYFNTLYNEFSVILGSFFAVSTLVLLTQGSMQPRSEKAAFWLLMFSLIWLGFSKQQYMPLASFLSILAALIMGWRKRHKHMVALLMCALMFPILYARLNNIAGQPIATIDLANKTDTFMAAVLPEVTDQSLALRELGLPSSCMAAIGKSWYDPELQRHNPCPELKHTSRLKLLKVFWREPAAAYMPLYKGILNANKMYPNYYLGYVENPSQLEETGYHVARFGSITILLSTLSVPLFFGITTGSLLCCALSSILLILRFRKGPNDQHRLDFVVMLLIAMGGFLVLYALVSSVFGDGYVELAKHAVVIGQGFVFQLGGMGVACWQIVRKLKCGLRNCA